MARIRGTSGAPPICNAGSATKKLNVAAMSSALETRGPPTNILDDPNSATTIPAITDDTMPAVAPMPA